MRNIGIDDQCTPFISSMLVVNKFLKSFDISNNQITNNGLKYVLEGFGKNETLRHLSIVNNPIDY